MSDKLQVGNYQIDLPSTGQSTSDTTLSRIVDGLMSLQVGDSLNSEAGRIERVGTDTFKVIIDDDHFNDSLKKSLTSSMYLGIDHGD